MTRDRMRSLSTTSRKLTRTPFIPDVVLGKGPLNMGSGVKGILAWGTRSVVGYLCLSLLTFSLPLFALGMWTNFRAGHSMADVGSLVVLSLAGGLIPGLLLWLFLIAYVQLRQQKAAIAVDTSHKIQLRPATEVETMGEPQVRYRWIYDAEYYSTVMERYYTQAPRLRRPSTQYALLCLAGAVICAVIYRPSTVKLVFGALAAGAVGIPALTAITRIGIRVRYMMRSSFGTEADLLLSPEGVTISQKSLNGTYGWTTYARAARFRDGIMLVKTGAIRWLPDSALVSGTVEDAMRLVSAHLTVRDIGELMSG